jgi:hypothetical protein
MEMLLAFVIRVTQQQLAFVIRVTQQQFYDERVNYDVPYKEDLKKKIVSKSLNGVN